MVLMAAAVGEPVPAAWMAQPCTVCSGDSDTSTSAQRTGICSRLRACSLRSQSTQTVASSEPVSCHSDAGTALCLASLCLLYVELPPVCCVEPVGEGPGGTQVPGGIILFAGVSHHGGFHLPLVLSFCVSVVL